MNGMSLNGYVNFHLYVLNGERLIRWFRWWAVVFFLLIMFIHFDSHFREEKTCLWTNKMHAIYTNLPNAFFMLDFGDIFFHFFLFLLSLYKRLFKIVNIVVQIIFYSNQFHVFRIIIFWSFNISNLIFCVKIKFSN